MKRPGPLACALLALSLSLVAVTGCASTDAAAAIAGGRGVLVEVQQQKAAATTQLTAATQPADVAKLSATTQQLDKTEQALTKALDVASAIAQAAQARSVDDPAVAKAAASLVAAAVPGPWGPIAASAIPLAILGYTWLSDRNKQHAAITTLAETTANAHSVIAQLATPAPPAEPQAEPQAAAQH